jgi:hypothetical protein
MTDRLREALVYRAQGFHPIPTRAGSKILALPPGTRERYERQQPRSETLKTWFADGRQNIALLLGPLPRLLCLNINMKHGQDGLASLNGSPLPATPTILTPHNSLDIMTSDG